LNALSPDWQRHEMIVSAAFMTACNAGSLQGCGLEEFVARFVSELIALKNEWYTRVEPMVEIQWAQKGHFKIQFMFPFETELPLEIHELLDTVESTRPPNCMQFDAGTYERTTSSDGKNKKTLKIICEAKSNKDSKCRNSCIKLALNRQDSNAKVSFIVVEKSVQHLKKFRIDDIKSLNRGKHNDSFEFAEGDDLKTTRFFKVEVDENRKLFLTPMDGKSSKCATRLILLISIADLASELEKTTVKK
jgi:hypothetical protein